MVVEKMERDIDFDGKFERLLEYMGGFGRYQIIVYILFVLTFMLFTANNNMLVFGAIKPIYSCVPNSSLSHFANFTERSLSCDHLALCPPEDISVTAQHSFHSLVMEFNLVCEREITLSTVIAVQMVGLGIGSVVGGKLADMYGRKTIYIIATVPQILLGLAASQSVSWQMFSAIVFFMGICLGAWATVSFTHLIEILGSKHRFKINPYGAGTIADLWLASLAYFTSSWRPLMFIGNLGGLVSIPILIFAVTESPRWLLHKGRHEQAEQVMTRISRWNGHKEAMQLSIWDDLLKQSKKDSDSAEAGETKLGYFHLVSNIQLRKITLTMGFCWFSFSVVIYGLYFNVWTLPGSPYVIYTLMSLLSWVAQTVALVVERKCVKAGRRVFMLLGCCGVIVCVVAITIYLVVNDLTSIDQIRFSQDNIITGLAIFASAFTMILFMTCWTMSTELYPISVRNTAQGLLNGCSRVGAILSPYILLEPSRHWAPILYINIAILTFIAMISIWWFLPETKNASLPSKMSSVSLSKKVSAANF